MDTSQGHRGWQKTAHSKSTVAQNVIEHHSQQKRGEDNSPGLTMKQREKYTVWKWKRNQTLIMDRRKTYTGISWLTENGFSSSLREANDEESYAWEGETVRKKTPSALGWARSNRRMENGIILLPYSLREGMSLLVECACGQGLTVLPHNTAQQ